MKYQEHDFLRLLSLEVVLGPQAGPIGDLPPRGSYVVA